MNAQHDDAATGSGAQDLVVVGAGAAGLMAAARGAAAGREVVLLERDLSMLSNTGICGGLVPAAGTRWQQAAGIRDDAAQMAADIRAKNRGRVDEAVLDAVCRSSADVMTFLADTVGLEIHLHTTILHPGLSRHRLHATPGETGAEIAWGLLAWLRHRSQVHFEDGFRVVAAIVEDDRVVGVRADDGREVRGSKVVLACGGFGANTALLNRYCPQATQAYYMGSTSNDGTAIEIGNSLGAKLAHMSGYQGHSHANPDHDTHLGGSLPSLGAILVNLHGQRFAREDQGYSEFAASILAQPGNRAVEVFDAKAHAQARSLGPFREALEAGAVVEAATPQALAEAFKLPADAFVRSLSAYNAAVRSGTPDVYGRRHFRRVLAPPLYGSMVAGALAHTQGGLRIDAQARVLDDALRPIAGLWAAGGAAAGLSGDDAAGYLSGNGLAHALATGMIAAESALELSASN